MVKNKLDYEVDENNENEERCPGPGENKDSQENAGQKAVTKGPGDGRPVSPFQMVES